MNRVSLLQSRLEEQTVYIIHEDGYVAVTPLYHVYALLTHHLSHVELHHNFPQENGIPNNDSS